ncbi:hypothetical protein [Halosegnis marinus]|uniref:Uncharacterized protein n=1 Tax=Halosegnis marinus TaxID=3034023 RepID=A0ABD5ZQ94_9EURY|nr:hypothetical protein [Halosegnis sp. DT85]
MGGQSRIRGADDAVRPTARELSERLATVFRAHDAGDYDRAVESLAFIDRAQFPALSDDRVEDAARAFVDALWAKDRVEFGCLRNGDLDAAALREADYAQVRQKLRQRASVVGADEAYATAKAEAWRRHKVGGDYWTPFQRSQLYELRAIFGDDYPAKPRAGRSGPGPEAMRYVLAFELHDMHAAERWAEGIDVMVPYFERILAAHEESD